MPAKKPYSQPGMSGRDKRYDRRYFDRWYRAPASRIDSADALERKVRLAVAAAEFMLGHPIRSVLDVACGEGRWFPVLRRLRPRVRYTGVDASEYAVQRYGRSRHIRAGTFGGLRALGLPTGFDLIVCADALQYIGDADLARGLREIRRLLAGVAFIEAFADEDAMEGDMEGWHRRSAANYRRTFRAAGLRHCGFHCWIDLRKLPNVGALEMAAR